MSFRSSLRVGARFGGLAVAGLAFAVAVTLPACSGGDGGGEGGAAAALGQACEAAEECPGELICHYDSEDYIAHRQCTLECTDSDQCEAKFGEDSFCIGAGVCVKACEEDAECPDKTRCGGSGWCERAGKDSGNPFCSGSPTPCGLLSDYDCSATLGCQRTGTCTGVPPGCYGSSRYSCESTSGCSWSSFNETCSGSPTPCSSYFTESSCISALGCSFNGSCTGFPTTTSCEDEYVALCEYTAGCFVVH